MTVRGTTRQPPGKREISIISHRSQEPLSNPSTQLLLTTRRLVSTTVKTRRWMGVRIKTRYHAVKEKEKIPPYSPRNLLLQAHLSGPQNNKSTKPPSSPGLSVAYSGWKIDHQVSLNRFPPPLMKAAHGVTAEMTGPVSSCWELMRESSRAAWRV